MTDIKLTSLIDVKLVQHVGNDDSIAAAAWVSTLGDAVSRIKSGEKDPTVMEVHPNPEEAPDSSPEMEVHTTGAKRGTDLKGYKFFLMSPIAIRRYASVMAEGAEKYGYYNWEKGFPISDLIDHTFAHLLSYLEGDRSEDHLGHALWNICAAVHSEEAWPHLNSNLRPVKVPQPTPNYHCADQPCTVEIYPECEGECEGEASSDTTPMLLTPTEVATIHALRDGTIAREDIYGSHFADVPDGIYCVEFDKTYRGIRVFKGDRVFTCKGICIAPKNAYNGLWSIVGKGDGHDPKYTTYEPWELKAINSSNNVEEAVEEQAANQDNAPYWIAEKAETIHNQVRSKPYFTKDDVPPGVYQLLDKQMHLVMDGINEEKKPAIRMVKSNLSVVHFDPKTGVEGRAVTGDVKLCSFYNDVFFVPLTNS